MLFSDDGGESWQYGDPAADSGRGESDEVQMAELSDGSVILNTRSHKRTGYRKIAVSNDGGKSWSPLADELALPDSGCMGSILRYSFGEDRENRLLFANPNSQKDRTNGTVRLSYDDGKTWPIQKVVHPGKYAYSCLTRLNDGSIGILFEADAYAEIKLARFTLEWLTGRRD